MLFSVDYSDYSIFITCIESETGHALDVNSCVLTQSILSKLLHFMLVMAELIIYMLNWQLEVCIKWRPFLPR